MTTPLIFPSATVHVGDRDRADVPPPARAPEPFEVRVRGGIESTVFIGYDRMAIPVLEVRTPVITECAASAVAPIMAEIKRLARLVDTMRHESSGRSESDPQG